jgi:hypothetical protein
LGQEAEKVQQNASMTSWLPYFEYAIIGIILYLQIRFWRETRAKISMFRETFPDRSQFKLVEIKVLLSDLRTVAPMELLENLKNYVSRATVEQSDIALHFSQLTSKIHDEMPEDNKSYEKASNEAMAEINKLYGPNWKKGLEKATITLLAIGGEKNEILGKITRSINTYLLRNRGAVSDFNLLRDIVQRNLDTVEEEILTTIPVPVYLGLMGTMMGIIVGLFGLPDVGSSAFLEGGGINGLIGGVKIAMIASFTGLLFTVSNSGFAFKGAKNQVEGLKNDFFTFLQTELLPVLTESVNSGIIGLNRNIERFGTSFNENVQTLDVLIRKNYESLMAQQKGIETLQRMDISKVANLNVKVLGELTRSVGALEGLANHLRMLDQFVSNSRDLVERTQNVVGLSEQFMEVLSETKQLQRYLNSHFSHLEERGQIITNTVVRLDDVIDKSLNGLEQHIHERLQAVKDIKITAEDLLQKEFSENKNVLGKLQFLEPLKNEFSKYSKDDSANQKEILNTLNTLQQRMTANNQLLGKVLSQLQKTSLTSQIKNIFTRAKKDKAE